MSNEINNQSASHEEKIKLLEHKLKQREDEKIT